jgi:hypothetical protein
MVNRIVLAALSLVLVASPSVPQVPPRCLHGADERPDQRTRRDQALALAEQINRAENAGPTVAPRRGQPRTYRPLDQLGTLPPTPAGFSLQFTTDGATYTFSIKDTRDPCRYAVFSDQALTIYEAVGRRGAAVRPADVP